MYNKYIRKESNSDSESKGLLSICSVSNCAQFKSSDLLDHLTLAGKDRLLILRHSKDLKEHNLASYHNPHISRGIYAPSV